MGVKSASFKFALLVQKAVGMSKVLVGSCLDWSAFHSLTAGSDCVRSGLTVPTLTSVPVPSAEAFTAEKQQS